MKGQKQVSHKEAQNQVCKNCGHYMSMHIFREMVMNSNTILDEMMSRKEYEQSANDAVGLAFVKAWSKRWVWLEDGRGWVCSEHGIKGCPPCTELAVKEDQHNQSNR